MNFLLLIFCIFAADKGNSTSTPTQTPPSSSPTPSDSPSPSPSEDPSPTPPESPISSTPTDTTNTGSGKATSTEPSFTTKNLVWIVIGSVAVGVLLIGSLLYCCAKSIGNGNSRKDTDAVLPWMHRPIQLQGSRPSVSSGSTPVQFGSSESTGAPSGTQQFKGPLPQFNNQPMQPNYGYEYNNQPYDQQYDQQYDQSYGYSGSSGSQQYSQYPQRIESPVLDQNFGLGLAHDQIPTSAESDGPRL